ncbi:MAG: NifB/NifX family molybdenum-iron cluster-binding protein [Roseburia sp.]
MDKESYLIAAASSDGIVVNSHFGRAETFYIYEVKNDDEIHLVEKREVTPVCNGGNHSDEKLKDNLLKFKDCRYLLVSRIGNGAANMAESLGIEVYELPGIIEESIHQLINYIKIEKLFA